MANVPPIPIGPFRKSAPVPDTNVRLPGPNGLNDSSDFRNLNYFKTADYMTPEPADGLFVNRNTSFGTNSGNPPI